jgi:hypothetical protein
MVMIRYHYLKYVWHGLYQSTQSDSLKKSNAEFENALTCKVPSPGTTNLKYRKM